MTVPRQNHPLINKAFTELRWWRRESFLLFLSHNQNFQNILKIRKLSVGLHHEL